MARGVAIDGERSDRVIVAQAFANRARDGFQMRVGGSRADDEEIGESGDASQIEDDEVLGFFFSREMGAGPGEFFGG